MSWIWSIRISLFHKMKRARHKAEGRMKYQQCHGYAVDVK
jgi:hypothetical protein